MSGAEVVRDLQAGGLGGVPEGQGQQGRGGRRRRVDRAVRAGPEGEPVQAVESDVVGELFPAAGAGGGDTEAGRQGVRVLGVPTVADRIAQTVAAMVPGAGGGAGVPPRLLRLSAGAVGAGCGRRCAGSGAGGADWVIDLDIRAFFDNLDHDLVLKAVAHHTDQRWVLLYVRAVAESAAATAGRQPGRAGSRQPAGLGDLTVAGQPVHALRVRCLDGPGVPGRPVRAVLR